MCVLSFEDGMTALSWYAWLAFRSRVSMSAIGSVIVMVCGASLAAVPHALGLGDLALGLSAISGASVRPGQWVPGPVERSSRRNSPAGLAHARELPGVGHLPQADPAEAELAEHRVRTTAPLAAGVTADRELRLAGRLVDQSLLGHVFVSCPGSAGRVHDGLTGEGEAELAEQLTAFLVGRGGGDQRDVHAALPVDLVDVDLAEHRLLGQSEGVVAVPVELRGGKAPEVTDTGQGQRQQAVEELP